jgi:hypothetical protein
MEVYGGEVLKIWYVEECGDFASIGVDRFAIDPGGISADNGKGFIFIL